MRRASAAATARPRRSTASSTSAMISTWGSSCDVEVVDALGPDLVAAGRRPTWTPSIRRSRLMVDPSALATWANAITVGRLLLSPVMFWVIPDDAGAVVGGVRPVVRAVR